MFSTDFEWLGKLFPTGSERQSRRLSYEPNRPFARGSTVRIGYEDSLCCPSRQEPEAEGVEDEIKRPQPNA